MPLLVLRLAVIELVLRMQCGMDGRLLPVPLHLSKIGNGQTHTVDKTNHSWVRRTKHTEISRSIDASLLLLAFIGVVLVNLPSEGVTPRQQSMVLSNIGTNKAE